MPRHAALYAPSYWLLGDDQLQINKDAFVAHFKHSLLFNPSLLFSDSMAINNRVFRYLVEGEDPSAATTVDTAAARDFRELITPTTFHIAVREDENGSPRSLVEIRRDLIDRGKSRVRELDNSSSGLEFLSRAATITPFSIKRVSQIFSDGSIRIFEDPVVQKELPHGLWMDIQDLAREARATAPENFGLDFFFYHLQEPLVARRPGIDIERCIATVKEFAQLPYVTALPKAILTTPIYALQHARAFRICGGRSVLQSVPGEREDRCIRLTTGLANFGRGIALLSPNDILELRDTDEARAYFDARNSLNTTSFEDSKEYFFTALGCYVRCIEERIISAGCLQYGEQNIIVSVDIKERRKAALVHGMDYISDLFTYVTIASAIAGAEYTLPVCLGLVFVKPIKDAAAWLLTGKTGKKAANEAQGRRDQQIQQFAEEWRKESVNMEAQVDVLNPAEGELEIPNETLYNGRIT